MIKMTTSSRRRRNIISITLPFLPLAALLICCSGSLAKSTEDEQNKLSVSTKQRDITNPMTTVPTVANPSIPTATNPILNPSGSIPDNPTVMNPANPEMNPLATNPPVSSRSWCVATQSASQFALQVALDYACSHGADCSVIQPGATCYNPNSVRQHASFAFNSYYQKNPVPTSCNFGGTAVTTNTDPSSVTCQYASTSTTSSVLNTTNSNGARVFGAGRPNTPTISSGAVPSRTMMYCRRILVCFVSILLALQDVIHQVLLPAAAGGR